MVVHADWGSKPKKRCMARATLQEGRYLAQAPEPVDDPLTMIEDLRSGADEDVNLLIGFDFPIGLPRQYAYKVGIANFMELLPLLGRGEWSEFYCVAERAEQISLHRPFYPYNAAQKGSKKRQHLLDALNVSSIDELLRQCDKPHPGRPKAAAPIFWTLGANQVGKAAISGWRDVLAPALKSHSLDVAVWPFDGTLNELLGQRQTVVAETYPAEFYWQLGLDVTNKRDQKVRKANACALMKCTPDCKVVLSPELRSTIEDGFGSSPDGEDPFDSVVGLFGMLNVLLGCRESGEPADSSIQNVEGWMLGRPA